MSIQRGKGAFLDHVFFCLSMVSTRIFHQLVGLGQYSTSGVAPLCPVNRHESDPFVESAFSSQALHPTYQRHSWPLQALSRRLRSSQQRPPSLFLSLWNIHPLAMIWTRLWTPGLPFRTLLYKVRLKPDSQRLKPLETIFAARLNILQRPCEASCCAWWVPLSLWWHRRSKFWLEGCVNLNFRILIEIHWFPTQLFERVVFFFVPRESQVVESFTKTPSEGDRSLFAMGLGNIVSGTHPNRAGAAGLIAVGVWCAWNCTVVPQPLEASWVAWVVMPWSVCRPSMY